MVTLMAAFQSLIGRLQTITGGKAIDILVQTFQSLIGRLQTLLS